MKMVSSLACVLGFTLGSPAMAQSYDIPSFTIDGGGGTSTGGSYTLAGTIGQPDPGQALTGGTYTLRGGFWPAQRQDPALCADLNGDGVLNNTDINLFVNAFLTQTPDGDFNNDGFWNNTDINAFVAGFLVGC